MDKKEALYTAEKVLRKPTCALLGLTLLAGTTAVAEISLSQDSQPLIALERSKIYPYAIVAEAVTPITLDSAATVPSARPEEVDAMSTDTASTAIAPEQALATTTTVPLELPQEVAVQPELAVEAAVPAPVTTTTTTTTTIPVPTTTTVPPAEPLDQINPACPADWEAISQDICYIQQAGFHVIQVDASSPDISVCPAFVSGPGHLGALADAARQMKAIAATNSSFFYENGRNQGPLACAGQWISQDPYPQIMFAHHTDGTVSMEHTEQALQQDVASLRFAVSGSHVLVHDGQAVQDFGADNEGGMLYTPHERTAIGMGESQQLYMAVTETGHRVTMPQLARQMGSLGVRNAINLDGGGSSQMYMNNQNIVPSERQISTGFFVVPTSQG